MRRAPKGFSLIEIMIVILITGIVLAIAVPSFLKARQIAQANSCQENLTKVDAAKQSWAIENSIAAQETPDWDDIVGVTLFLRKVPTCPGGGTYALNSVSILPTCTISTQASYPHTLE